MTTLSAKAALDRYYLETRCKLIEIAANLDRIDRGGGADEVRDNPRMVAIRSALAVLADGRPDRAERCQMVFSLPYEESWRPPNAR